MREAALRAVEGQREHAVVVHYHEIALKGRNRGMFERRLVRNLEAALRGSGAGPVEVLRGRLLVRTAGPAPEGVLRRIGRTFGVAVYAPALVVRADLEEMSEAGIELVSPRTPRSFAVAARRATKGLPFTSRDVNVEVGARLQAATGAAVNLSHPDVTVHIEVVGQRALVYADRLEGPGGLPVGVSGKVVVLLSGGIDSPVASYRMARRGAKAVLCHFHSAPFTDTSSVRKAAELARIISSWQGPTLLYAIPFGAAQKEIVMAAPPDLRVVLYRRLMVRVATAVARREGARALVVGDSLGQVASQTLENIACVDDVAELPVLRPLVGDDKLDIVREAQRIGTYETSILPFADCCTLFVPKSPATRASVEECRRAESELDIEGLVVSCLEGASVERIGGDEV